LTYNSYEEKRTSQSIFVASGFSNNVSDILGIRFSSTESW
jgi:hypothetical protein